MKGYEYQRDHGVPCSPTMESAHIVDDREWQSGPLFPVCSRLGSKLLYQAIPLPKQTYQNHC